MDMFQESLKNCTLPSSLKQALIPLMPKPDKPQTKCESYRLILLINTDAKILAKILALRLEVHLPDVINNDKNGLVKNRQA